MLTQLSLAKCNAIVSMLIEFVYDTGLNTILDLHFCTKEEGGHADARRPELDLEHVSQTRAQAAGTVGRSLTMTYLSLMPKGNSHGVDFSQSLF